MPAITLYSKPNCPLCDHTRYYLQTLLAERGAAGWTVDEVSILDDQALYAAYRYTIPVVVIDGREPIAAPESLDVGRLRAALDATAAVGAVAPVNAAAPPPGTAGTGQPPAPSAGAAYYPVYGPPSGGVLGALDRFGTWLSEHWLALLNSGVGGFSTLPWLAPVFAGLGWWFLADPIYTIYMFFCHQLPERAGSLFGYQVAYCYRNSAIYSTIFGMGLLFAVARRQGPGGRLAHLLRPIRWPVFVLLLLPIAVDGLTHLFGLREDNAWFDMLTGGRFGDFSVGDSLGTLNWWLRIISGTLFGFAVVRLLYPWIQVAFDQSRSYYRPVAPLPLPADPVRPPVVSGEMRS